MRSAGLVLVIAIVGRGVSLSREISAQQISADIAKRGGKAISSELNRGKGVISWNSIADHAASGDASWLRVAAALIPYADAGNAESLENGVSDALPKAPEQVLGLLGLFRVDHVCGGAQFIEAPEESVRRFLVKARTAVNGVSKPELAGKKIECLHEIDLSLRNLKRR